MIQKYETLLLTEETLSDLVEQSEREAKRQTRYTLMSTVAGAIIGWIVGVVQLIYIGSWPLIYWAYMPLIPLYSALGGALYGMIFGGGGFFESKASHAETSSSKAAHTHAA
jgi:hypothetical protein